MKKLILLSLIAVFIFASCTTTTAPAPKKVVDVDNLEFYAPGKDTTVSWKSFEKKFHKGHLETCPGEFRPVKWISYDSTNHSVTLRLQGERITADSLKKILNPNEVPVVTTPPADSDDSVSGSENSDDSSSGFWTSPNWLGIPWWIWLLIGIILLLIIWRLLRGGDNGGTHHTHTHNHTHQYAPYVRQHEQGVGVNQQNATAQSHTEGHSHQTVSSNMPQRYVIRNGRVTINNARGNTQQMDVEINGGEVEINNN